MNSAMINNREYVDQLHTVESSINEQLIDFANKFYRENLTPFQVKEILSLSLQDKQWLLEQYKEENKSYSQPELHSIY